MKQLSGKIKEIINRIKRKITGGRKPKKTGRRKWKIIIPSVIAAAAVIYFCFNNGLYFDRETHLPGFYYLNTAQNVSDQEFLTEFNEIVDSRADLKELWSDIREDLNTFLSENAQNLNQERILKMVKNLSISYSDDMSDTYASTNFPHNRITFSRRFTLKNSAQKKEITEHEAFHMLFGKGLYGSVFNYPVRRLGIGLDEGLAQELTKETGAYAGVTRYKHGVYYLNSIAEIIGSDCLLDAFNSNDVWKLIGYLSKYCSFSEAYRLLTLIDSGYGSLLAFSDSDEEAWEIIEKMYENKNGISVEDSGDVIMNLYAKSMGGDYCLSDEFSGYYTDIKKNYFVNRDETPSIELIKDNKTVKVLYLNEDNSLKN